MKKATWTAGLGLGLALAAFAGPMVRAHAGAMIQLASQNCIGKGQQVAASRNATLVGAQAVSQGGRPVCKIVILVQGQGGERPRREVVYVDQ